MTSPVPMTAPRPSWSQLSPAQKAAVAALGVGALVVLVLLFRDLGGLMSSGPETPERLRRPEVKKKELRNPKLAEAGAAWRAKWAAMTHEERVAYKAAKRAKKAKKKK